MRLISAGCQTCKIRRIKCDETKPTCQKCSKSRRICLSTSTVKEACFSIHLENSYASGENKRPRGPRSSLTMLRPQFDLQTRALSYYLQNHLHTLTDVSNASCGVSDCVSAWTVSGRICHMVDLALSAVALTVFSRTQRCTPAATEASSRYHRLLQVAQIEILALNERNIDACLLAVLLMGRYESVKRRPGDLNSGDSSMSPPRWFHRDGLMAILEAWNNDISHSSTTLIIKQIRRGLIKTSLLVDLPLPDWMLNGDRFGEHDLELYFDRIVVRLINLHYACASLQQKTFQRIAKTGQLNNEAQELDKALKFWATQISSTCSYQQHVLTIPGPLPRSHFFSSIVYSYSSLGYAAAWGQYFAMRMLINSTRLKVLEMSRPTTLIDFTYKQQRLEYTNQLEAMADSLASTIPFCLERFKIDNPNSRNRQGTIRLNTNEEIKPYLASLLVWQLAIASRIEEIDVGQQLWFKSELAGLGEITGDGILEPAIRSNKRGIDR